MSIKVSGVRHIYSPGLPQESLALDNINFEVEDGDFVGVIGHTGSGKSTLMQHLNGLLRPSEGHIIINGVDITDEQVLMKEIRSKIGLVFQYPEYQLFEETVAKDVAFGPTNLGLSEQEIEKRVIESIEMVGFDYQEIKNASPFELSGGQKRRIAIAGVIAMKPEVLILDEPTAGLNPMAHNDILELIKSIHAEEKSTVFLVSHNMDDVANLCSKVLVMNHGTIIMNGSPITVFARALELTELGLDVPSATDIILKLNQNGFDIQTDEFDLDKIADNIVKGLK